MNYYKTILLALHGLLLSGLAANAQTPDFTAAPAPAKDISWYVTHCPFPMAAPVAPDFPDRDFPLTDYGAIGDGQTLNTSAFQKAIRACSAAGGGRVVASGARPDGPQLLDVIRRSLGIFTSAGSSAMEQRPASPSPACRRCR